MLFLDLLKDYLNKNLIYSVGYNDDEIRKIEKLYNINCNGHFKELLLFSGRNDGGFFGNHHGFVLYNEWTIYEHIKYQIFFRDILYDAGHIDWYHSKPFVFSVIDGVMYYFLATNQNNNIVYSFFDDTEEVLKTNLTLDDYLMLRAIELHAPCSTLQQSISGELINLDK